MLMKLKQCAMVILHIPGRSPFCNPALLPLLTARLDAIQDMRLHLLELYWVVPMCQILYDFYVSMCSLILNLCRLFGQYVRCWCSGALLSVVPETILQMSVPRQWRSDSLSPLCHGSCPLDWDCENIIMRGSRVVPIPQQPEWVCLGFISPQPRTFSDNFQIFFSSLSSFFYYRSSIMFCFKIGG